jgi:hypothetical protein
MVIIGKTRSKFFEFLNYFKKLRSILVFFIKLLQILKILKKVNKNLEFLVY